MTDDMKAEIIALLREKYGQCPDGGYVGFILSERQLRGIIDALGVDAVG